MSGSARFSRVLSLRETRKPSKSTADYHGLFTLEDNAKRITKEEDKKVQDIVQQLATLGNTNVPPSRIEYALRATSVNGDITKALDLLMLFEDTVAGIVKPWNPTVRMLGAQNRDKVTCFLDALLFAMFAKTNVFEAVLYHTYDDEPRRRLTTVVRLWVNLMRTGRLITIDITRHLQEALADCGWPEAGKLRQQDASEAFGMITDKLNLPLLTLKTDIFHAGKEDTKDDHKFITERLLDVAIPEDTPEGKVLTLEQCLEEYFNNKVEIKRELARRTTAGSLALRRESTEKGGAVHVEAQEVDSTPNTPGLQEKHPTLPVRPAQLRERAPSIFSERKVEAKAVDTSDDKSGVAGQGRPRVNSVRKEVLMPAWQFLNLIPWYTDNTTETDAQIKAHFSTRRPMLGICLKRYTMNKHGNPVRLNTQVDIPLEMIPPHFAVDENGEGEGGRGANLKLVLQSVVCHRGQHVTSGHYIAMIRAGVLGEPSKESFSELTQGQKHDSSLDLWLRHDDLAADRVALIDIKQALKDEYPYLLFYQVLPIDNSVDGEEEPPPYQESGGLLNTSISEKLAGLPGQGRLSTETAEAESRRASVAASEARSQASTGEAVGIATVGAADSMVGDGGSKTEQSSMGPTTPLDEGKNSSRVSLSRPSSRPKASRPSSDASEKLMSRLTSRLGREKSSQNVEVVVTDEVAVDDKEATQGRLSKDDSPGRPRASKVKREKKFKGLGSRRSSGLKQNAPERECSMM